MGSCHPPACYAAFELAAFGTRHMAQEPQSPRSEKLRSLIEEERELFQLDDDVDDGHIVTDEERSVRHDEIHRLRETIANLHADEIDALKTKAEYVERLFADTGETLSEAASSDGFTDHALGLIVVRDLLSILRNSPDRAL
jgi:hypothetical protein